MRIQPKPTPPSAPPAQAGAKPAPATAAKVNTAAHVQDGFTAARQTATASGGSNPPVGSIGNGATYAPVQNGQLFVQEPGDSSPISPRDISQGGVGDCYFLSSLGELAEQHPEVIRNNLHDNGNGTYTVTFHEKRTFHWPWESAWKTVKVTVNGDLPQNYGSTVFAGTPSANGKQETWVAIYEKAYAQYKGGYDKIKPSSGSYAMPLLTGHDAEQHSTGSVSASQAASWLSNHNGLTAVSLPDSKAQSNPAYQNGTLVSGHVYYVQSVNPRTNTVALQNPWGYSDQPITMSWSEFQKNFCALDRGTLA